MLPSIKLLSVMACMFMLASSQSVCKKSDLIRVLRTLNRLEGHILRLEEKIEDLADRVPETDPLPMDCDDVREQRQEATIESGLYLVQAPGLLKRRIYCNFTEEETWTTISRRVNGEDIFNRTWNEYKHGFGKASGDYWIGNELLHQITCRNSYYLRITMNGRKISSYKSFRIDDEDSHYRLLLGAYDSANSNGGDSFSPTDKCKQNGNANASFSTYDYGDARNCSKTFSGGWWFTNCGCSNLNGKYVHGGSVPTSGPNIGLYWDTLYHDRWGGKSSLRKVIMEIKIITGTLRNNYNRGFEVPL